MLERSTDLSEKLSKVKSNLKLDYRKNNNTRIIIIAGGKMKKIKEEKSKQTNKKIEGYWECGVCKKAFPADPEKSPEEIIPAWIKIEVGNEEHRIPICEDCLRHILYE